MAEDDLYRVLGVARDADADTIKAAWRDAARRLHPDRNPGNADAAAEFSRMSAAWAILGDEDKRLVYDRFGADAVRESTVAELARAIREERSRPASPPPRRGPVPQGSGPDPIPRTASRAAKAPPRRASDVRVGIQLSLREAAAGGPRPIHIQEDGPCSDCDATGLRPSGRFCPACQGKGYVQQAREVFVDVPISVSNGQALRFPGQGRAGSDGKRGNLIVDVQVAPDPQFQRIGNSLRTVAMFVAGATSIEVPTLDGSVTVELPPKARPGTAIRVAGKGMPGSGGRPAGDLLVTLR